MSKPAMMVLPAPGSSASKEAQRLARQHRLIDGGDLMRQRIDDRGMDGQHRVEQVRQTDALRLGHQAEECAIAIEAPRPTLLDQFSDPGSSWR
jgi:hypothetical protein